VAALVAEWILLNPHAVRIASRRAEVITQLYVHLSSGARPDGVGRRSYAERKGYCVATGEVSGRNLGGKSITKGPKMSESGHDLHTLFPDHGPALHALKLSSANYRQLAEEHHDLQSQIQRVEACLAALADDELEELKKRRLFILDEIAALIAVEENG
jgi:hypothetical protein